AEAWYESTIDTIYFTENVWQFKVLEWVVPFARKFGDMSRKLICQRALKGTMENRNHAIAQYQQHIEDVKAAVPAGRLLVYSADQGWNPLCKFLGVPVPETPFPNVNDRADVKKIIAGMTKGAYAILAAAAVIAAGMVYGSVTILT
ncbi:MAG: sulfotransferase family protein, partial [Aestuariivirga sp.]